MKNVVLLLAILCLGFITPFAGAASKPEVPPQAIVRSLTGKATATGPDGTARSLNAGDLIGAGDTLETAADASLVLDLGSNGNALKVRPGTVLTFEKLTRQQAGGDTVVDTSLNLKKGSVLGNVKKLNAASRYQVKTSNGIAGIRGTAFEIFAIGVYRCLNGQIVVTISNLSNPSAPPQAFTVTAGTGLGPNGGGAPTLAPIPPAELKNLMNDVRNLPQLLAGGIVKGHGLPAEMQEDIRRQVDHLLRQAANGDKPSLANTLDGVSAGTAAALAAQAAAAVLNRKGDQVYTPQQIQAASDAARAAYLTVISRDPSHPKAMAHAAAIAAASATLAGATPEQIVAAAAYGVQIGTAIILNGASLPELYYYAALLPTVSPQYVIPGEGMD